MVLGEPNRHHALQRVRGLGGFAAHGFVLLLGLTHLWGFWDALEVFMIFPEDVEVILGGLELTGLTGLFGMDVGGGGVLFVGCLAWETLNHKP